jgi:hypothetical protein
MMGKFMHDHYQNPFRESQGNAAEILRLIRIAASGWHCGFGGIFQSPERDWQDWLKSEFQIAIAPHFIACHEAASQMQAREIAAADLALDKKVSNTAAIATSRASGAELLATLASAKPSKLATKLSNLHPVVHLVTAAAIQSVEFHFPLHGALLTYLYFEWRAVPTDSSIETFLQDESGMSDVILKAIQGSRKQTQNLFCA